MKLCSNVLGEIGNPNFCNAEKALGFAMEARDISAWKLALARLDLHFEKAIEAARIAREYEVWQVVLARPDVDSFLAFDFALKLYNNNVWVTVLSRLDVNFFTAYERAIILKDQDVWLAVLCRDDSDPKSVLERAAILDLYDVWSLILRLEHILKHINQLAIPELVTLTKKAGSLVLWNILLSKEGVDARDLLFHAKDFGASVAWETVIPREDVKKYLDTLTSEQLTALAIEIDAKKFWNKVLRMPIIKPDDAFFYLKETDDDFPWHKVLKRDDVIDWLDSLEPDALLALGIKINHFRIWKVIIKRANVVDFINKLGPKESIELAVAADNINLTDLIIGREDFPFLDVFEIAKASEDGFAWSEAVKKPDFVAHINALSDDDAISFAKLHNNYHIWDIVLSRPSIEPARVIELAHIANNQDVWDTVMKIKTVVALLGKKKN